jgi:lipid-binding SYLF domain-containing protein
MKTLCLVCGPIAALLLLAGCSTAPKSQSDREALQKEAEATIVKFKAADVDMQRFFTNAAGYAVFPSILKGGWFVGGAHGQGIIYEKGPNGYSMAGYVDTTHASIGLQFGGQTFSEIVFLETAEAVKNFESGKMKFSASVSAVAAKAGASRAVNYAGNVAVFTLAEAGLMVEGAVGAQKFGFKPK